MSRRFLELVVRARRLVSRAPSQSRGRSTRVRATGRRQVGDELTQFSFRLALMIDLAYVGVGVLGGAAVGRASASSATPSLAPAPACRVDSVAAPPRRDSIGAPNDTKGSSGTGPLDQLGARRESLGA
jgi:hypothetical protein